MASIAKFKHGGKTLDLTAAPYTLGLDFMPPALNMSINWAEGTSANRGGAVRKGERYNNRSWSFSVRVMGASEMECQRHARRLEEWLALAGDEDNPLQFAYAPDDSIPYEPLYGQSWMYYTVKGGIVSPARYESNLIGVALLVVLNLVVGPYAEGMVQHVFSALGGVYDDYIGVPGKRARGPSISEGTTNLFLNPILSHTTYDTGFTSTDLTDLRNNNPEFIIMGDWSAELTMTAATAQFTASIAVGDTDVYTLSFYAKKIDSSAVTATDCKVYYGADKTSTYESCGDGWYRVYATVDGIAAATASGVALQTIGGTLYVDGFQLEKKAYPTTLAVGDLPGCIWTANTTPHATTSVRTAGVCLFGSLTTLVYKSSSFSMRIVSKWQHANTFTADRYIFDAGSLESYFEADDDKIYITDGTNTVSTAALTFVAGDVVVYHYAFDAGRIELYINGVKSAADGTSFVPTESSNFFIGSNAAGASQINATIMDFTTWDRALTDAQILADYTNINSWMNDETEGNPLTPLPWEWYVSSGMTTYGYNDATHRSYFAYGSIPGVLPAETFINVHIEANDLILSNLPVDYIYPCNPYIYFMDCAGTGDTDALGAAVLRTSVDTTEVAISTSYDIPTRYSKPLSNQKMTFYAVLADAGSNLLCRGGIYEGATYLGYTNYASLTVDSSYRNFMLPTMLYPTIRKDDITNNSSFTSGTNLLILRFKRSTGGASNVDLDYWMVFFGAVAYIPVTQANTEQVLVTKGQVELYTSGTNYCGKGEYRGDIIEFEPGKINYLTAITGPLNGVNDFANDYTQVFTSYIIPRWGLL